LLKIKIPIFIDYIYFQFAFTEVMLTAYFNFIDWLSITFSSNAEFQFKRTIHFHCKLI